MKNKIILNIVLVYFIVVSIVLVSQLYLRNNDRGDTPITETVKLVDRLNNAVVLYNGSPVMLVNKRQTLLGENNFNTTPVVENGHFYVPLGFFDAAYGAVTESDAAKKQAVLRLDNTAVVFNSGDKTARVISNSNERDEELENAAFYRDGMTYVPIDAFCSIFGKESFVYDDNMLIISPADENVAFDPNEEEELLQNIERQVNNLPLVLSESNIKTLLGVKNDIFGFTKEKSSQSTQAERPEEMIIDSGQSKKIACSDDFIYAAANGVIKIIDSTGETAEAVSEFPMQKGFTPDAVMTYENMLLVMGKGENAEMPVTEVKFDEKDSKEDKGVQKKIDGEGFFMLCYDISDKKAPVLKRWFYSNGELFQKQVFENSLCLVIRENALDLVKDGVYKTPSYCDLNKTSEAKYEDIKYLPEMKDSYFTSVFRFDMTDIQKEADADVFLGTGEDITIGQNYITFNAAGGIKSGSKEKKITNFYKINLSNGSFAHGLVDGSLVSLEKAGDGYAALVKDGSKDVLFTLSPMLETDNEMKLSSGGLVNISCIGDKAYLTDENKSKLLIVSLTQVYSDAEGEEEPRMIIQPQEKTLIPIDGVEYIKLYETSAVGLGVNKELNNAEISMWALKDSAVKTAGDSIGDDGSRILPVATKNIVDSEMAFNLSLYIKENDVSTEKYNGVYIYRISENNTPSLKGRITHNKGESLERRITDIAYLNGKYFTVSDELVMVNADDENLTELYSAEFK